MDKKLSIMKLHKKICSNIENGFCLPFFAMVIFMFIKPYYVIIAFIIAIAYFLAYFCIAVPLFKKYRNGIKNKIIEERKRKLETWYSNSDNKDEIKEKYSEYVENQFKDIVEETLDEETSFDKMTDISKDIEIILG